MLRMTRQSYLFYATASHFWNISQNVTREKHRSAVAGIASCITPGGDVFLPHEGRPLLGCEKLLLQGIPYFRLLLGNETEVQLGDLAGNAMSLTVVCACTLAAMTCKQLKRDHESSLNDDILETLKAINEKPAVSLEAKSEVKANAVEGGSTTDAKALFQTLSEVATSAINSSIWCTCESSGRNSRSANFLRCRFCSVACCRDCCHGKQGYQTDSHDMKDVTLSKEDHDLGSFEIKLRSIMPATLVLSKDGLDEISAIKHDMHQVADISGYVFCLHRIKRGRLKWIAVYYAREGGIGAAIAEFKITVGELEGRNDTTDPVVGVQGELTSFFPARREPIVLGPLTPCAFVRQCQGDYDLVWKVKANGSASSLVVIGEGACPSFRVEVGLTDVAADALKKHANTVRKKEYAIAQANGDKRRWVYADGWKVWPKAITIKDDGESGDIHLSGKYVRVDGHKHTFNQNACWVRRKTNDSPELYLLIKPDVSRVGPDEVRRT